jgi:hypothetical protein
VRFFFQHVEFYVFVQPLAGLQPGPSRPVLPCLSWKNILPTRPVEEYPLHARESTDERLGCMAVLHV